MMYNSELMKEICNIPATVSGVKEALEKNKEFGFQFLETLCLAMKPQEVSGAAHSDIPPVFYELWGVLWDVFASKSSGVGYRYNLLMDVITKLGHENLYPAIIELEGIALSNCVKAIFFSPKNNLFSITTATNEPLDVDDCINEALWKTYAMKEKITEAKSRIGYLSSIVRTQTYTLGKCGKITKKLKTKNVKEAYECIPYTKNAFLLAYILADGRKLTNEHFSAVSIMLECSDLDEAYEKISDALNLHTFSYNAVEDCEELLMADSRSVEEEVLATPKALILQVLDTFDPVERHLLITRFVGITPERYATLTLKEYKQAVLGDARFRFLKSVVQRRSPRYQDVKYVRQRRCKLLSTFQKRLEKLQSEYENV